MQIRSSHCVCEWKHFKYWSYSQELSNQKSGSTRQSTSTKIIIAVTSEPWGSIRSIRFQLHKKHINAMYSRLEELEERVKFYEKAVASEELIEHYHSERMISLIQRRDFEQAFFEEQRRDRAIREVERRKDDLKRAQDLLRRELLRREQEFQRETGFDTSSSLQECRRCRRPIKRSEIFYELNGRTLCYTCKSEPQGERCSKCDCKIAHTANPYQARYARSHPSLCKWCKYKALTEEKKHEQDEKKGRSELLERYEAFHQWNKEVENLIRERKIASFPWVPRIFYTCRRHDCEVPHSSKLGFCVHDVEECFGAGPTGTDELKKAYRNFHPDRFTNCCVEEFKETGRKLSEEMFKVIGLALGK